jgi:2-polyprenyl-3-methyl-5-hydroxy-6-metoxy-1,4-benzoquinol methylase
MSQRAEHLLPLVDVAEEVRDFYDRYPYPPPVDNLEKYQEQWQDRQRRRADFHLFWPTRVYREDHSILIAGCGTSQAAKHALRWPSAHVIGIDSSATSVRHTEALKKKYNLENLQVLQLAIEQVSELGMSFDQIVCTGVLHHLADPEGGLRALRSVLKPDGAMQLMVYAPYGRTGIYMLQEFCRQVGIRAVDEEIRDLIAALGALPSGHPLQSLLSQAPDFRNQAALADALLHPQDRAYSVPQLFEFLEKAGLTFGRWVRQAPYSVHCGLVAKIPQVTRLAQLTLAEQFAAIELFRGTMLRHSCIAYRNDSESCKQQAGVADDAWLDHIPIRMPDTICVQDRLPPGSAAVLINQTHTYRDLFLLIRATEKVWWDGIDGVRNISDIAETPPLSPYRTTNLDAVRAFFERLWWHDQVVFDSSQKANVHLAVVGSSSEGEP